MAQAALILAMACGGGGGGGGNTNTNTNTAPLIATQPASQTVNAGSAASFTVAASGTPAPTFTWERSNNNGTTWTAISGATNATYTFTAAKADHTAQFRATASNTVSPDATSTPATLSVQWLAITTQPGDKSVTAGSPATFTVVPDANPAATLQWQSSADGTTWANVAGATAASYPIAAPALSSTGTKYRCVLTNATGSINSNAATLTVTVLGIAPTITTHPASAAVTAGSPASFTVVAAGTAPLHYQWKKGTTNVGTDASTFSIASTTAGDAGSYTVTVSNGFGSTVVTSNAATLTVNVPPAITTQPASAAVTVGGPASFTVVATGTAPLHYQWKKGAVNVGTDAATYAIAAAATGDAGSYTVTVSNGFGTPVTSTAATLTVNVPPAITTQPVNASVTTGSPASFTVVATGTAPLHYQWKKGATNVGPDAATYTIAATTTGDAGSYTVTVSNGFGTPVISNAATLTVSAGPAITSFVAGAGTFKPGTITAGTSTILTYAFSGGTGTIDQGVGSVTSGGTSNVGPLSATTTYTLTVTPVVGPPATRQVIVTVVPAPSITSFTNAGLKADGTGATLTAVFTVDPAGTASVNQGAGTVPFTVTSGVPVATDPLATNATYVLTVTSAAGLSISASTTVAVLPVFTTNPAPQALVSGNIATFTVAASAVAPITGYTWQRSNDSGTSWSLIPGATGLSYVTPTLVPTDNGALFRAIATNSFGSTTSMAGGLNQNLTLTLTLTPTIETIELVLVPAGTFTMGETDTAPVIVSSDPATLPAHSVTFAKPFYMAKAPCTQAQWLAIVGGLNPSAFCIANGAADDDFTRPVEQVSYDDITATTTGFLDKLNAATASDPIRVAGGFFRLPTEAEYEYACRAGSTGQNNYYFGSYDSGSVDPTILALIDTYLWSSRNSASITIPLGSTHPVKSKLPNAWGLYDMAGNVWQLCQDDWHASYAATGTGVPALPIDGTAWMDTPRSTLRAFRGGSWQHNSHYGQSKARGSDLHTFRALTDGFRVVLQLP